MNIDLNSPESILLQLVPWILLLIWTIYVVIALSLKNPKSNLFSFHIVQNIPSIFVTLGVLGTFAGVTFGLLEFDLNPERIAQSIDGLLSGLKNAFFTSLYGLFASVISNVIIRFKYSKQTLQDPEIQEERKLIRELKQSIDDFGRNLAEYNSEAIMSSLRKVITDFNDTFSTLIGELVTDNFQKLTSSVDQLVE